MAGRLRNNRTILALLSLMTVATTLTALASAGVWDVRPSVADWWGRFTVLSDPAPRWATRVGGVPDLGVVMGSHVVVGTRGFVDGYLHSTGEHVWHHGVHWALAAGNIVVYQPRPENPDADPSRDKGYTVMAPAGDALWNDREAVAVWAFADQLVDLVCPGSGGSGCQLRGRNHRDGRQLWSATLPDGASRISGGHPPLVGTRDPSDELEVAARGYPGPIPPVLGLVVDDRLQLVDTVAGQRIREVTAPDRQTRLALSNGRILLSRAEPASSGCRYRVEALDARTGTSQWVREGYDLGSASGAGCEQRRDPLGAGNRLVVRAGDNTPQLLDVTTGDPVWTGVAGERILATDGLLVVVEGTDRTTVRVVDLLAAGQGVIWSKQVGLGAHAAVTREAVIVAAVDSEQVFAIGHDGSGQLVEVRTKATVIGYGARGLLLGSGRRIGLVPVSPSLSP